MAISQPRPVLTATTVVLVNATSPPSRAAQNVANGSGSAQSSAIEASRATGMAVAYPRRAGRSPA